MTSLSPRGRCPLCFPDLRGRGSPLGGAGSACRPEAVRSSAAARAPPRRRGSRGVLGNLPSTGENAGRPASFTAAHSARHCPRPHLSKAEAGRSAVGPHRRPLAFSCGARPSGCGRAHGMFLAGLVRSSGPREASVEQGNASTCTTRLGKPRVFSGAMLTVRFGTAGPSFNPRKDLKWGTGAHVQQSGRKRARGGWETRWPGP